ncbi:MAG: diguanylate cyclase [Bacteroidota bacterium]
MKTNWSDEVDFALTLCDTEGKIVHMNEVSKETFIKYGGKELDGQSLFDCHPEPAATLLASMLSSQERNVYTIEKNGRKKLIYQCPWYEKGIYMGFAELSFVLPDNMPHYIRK